MQPGSLRQSSPETNHVVDVARERRSSHTFVSTRERLAPAPRERRRSHTFVSTRERLAAPPPREKGR